MTIFEGVQDSVPLTECAARAVLTAKPRPHALRSQRREGERLGCGPVERVLTVRHFQAGFQDSLYFGVRVEVSGQSGLCFEQRCQFLPVDARLNLFNCFLRTTNGSEEHTSEL